MKKSSVLKVVAAGVAGVGAFGVKKAVDFINKYADSEPKKSIVGKIDTDMWDEFADNVKFRRVTNISFMIKPITLSYEEKIPLSNFYEDNELMCNMYAYVLSEYTIIIAPTRVIGSIEVGGFQINFSKFISLESVDGLNHISTPLLSCERMFYDLSRLKMVDMSEMNLSELRTTSSMFSGCNSLEKVIFPKYNLDSLICSSNMFYNCKTLKSVDITMRNMYNLTDTSFMFGNCYNLNTIDLSGITAINLHLADGMFYNVKSIENVPFENWNCNKILSADKMFYNTMRFTLINLSTWHVCDRETADKMLVGVNKKKVVIVKPSFN